ncbi:hypothetical protein UY3_11306 [Chelonia mydas]|uniref:Uncharacterized protein n=1 Tax=Chelonia mydas TaxID=8469 RepID=M7B7S3_CHEMY|nr:hypothetical protein UY3_11306 [Chelonia mydas]
MSFRSRSSGHFAEDMEWKDPRRRSAAENSCGGTLTDFNGNSCYWIPVNENVAISAQQQIELSINPHGNWSLYEENEC